MSPCEPSTRVDVGDFCSTRFGIPFSCPNLVLPDPNRRTHLCLSPLLHFSFYSLSTSVDVEGCHSLPDPSHVFFDIGEGSDGSDDPCRVTV